MASKGSGPWLESAFRVRAGEMRRVGVMFFYLLAVVSAFIVGRTTRDTLFLSRYNVDKLPFMYIAVAVGVSAFSWLYGNVTDRYRRDRVIITFLGASALVLFAVWGALFAGLAGGWLYPTLYVVVEIICGTAVIQFWTFANDIFSAREARRLFGFIGAGGVIANVVVGFTIGAAAKIVGAETLLLLCVALFVAAIGCVRDLAKGTKHELEAAVKKPSKKRRDEAGRIFSSKHLRIIAGITAASILTTTIIDYQFKLIAKQHFAGREADLAAFFGYFFGFTGIISCLVQFVATGRMLERAGIVFSLMVLPFSLLFGTFGLMAVPLVPALAAVTFSKSAETVFRYTLNNSSTQLLYVPVPAHHRGRAKAFIEGIVKPVFIGASGVLILSLAKILPSANPALDLAWADLVLTIVWMVLVFGVRGEYVRSLIGTLKSRRLDFEDLPTVITDGTTAAVLEEAMTSGREEDTLHALELVPRVKGSAHLLAAVPPLLAHPSKAVRVSVLRLLSQRADPANLPAIRALFADPAEDVRAAAITAACAVNGNEAIHTAGPFLDDPSPGVRAAAVIGLIKYGGLDGILAAAEPLKKLLRDPSPLGRVEGAHVLAEIKVSSFYQPVLELLKDPDPRVRVAAMEAATSMTSKELVPAVIERLGDRKTARAAARALVRFGKDVERPLLALLRDDKANAAHRAQVPAVLAQIGGAEALEALLAELDTPNPELGGQIARAISRMRERSDAFSVTGEAIEAAIRRELQSAYQCLAMIVDLGLAESDLLHEALMTRQKQRLGLVFRLLEVLHPARTIQAIWANLDSGSKAMRANAVEVADNILAKDHARLILPLIEDHPIPERVKAAADLVPMERLPAWDWIARLLDDPSPWMVACTIRYVEDKRLSAFRERIARHAKEGDAVVRETACVALARLVVKDGVPQAARDDLRALAEQASADDATIVRKAGGALLSALRPG